MQKRSFTSEELFNFIKEGSPVLFPTDTLPALAVAINQADKLWYIKKRPKTKPLILMGSSANELLSYVRPDAYEDALKISSTYWPGAITIVLPAINDLVQILNPFGNSIGMRIPKSRLALDLLDKSGPLATTSANLSGEEPSIDAEIVAKCFPDLPLLGPTPWPKTSGLASTLIEWKGSGRWQLLRRGAVIPSEVKK